MTGDGEKKVAQYLTAALIAVGIPWSWYCATFF